jgi:iron(III) transport system permease protein
MMNRRTAILALLLAVAVFAFALLRTRDPRTASLVANTLWLALAVGAIAMPLGTAIAWGIARTDLPGRRFFAAVLALLFLIPLYLQAAAWDAGFGLQGSVTLAALDGRVWLDGWFAAIWIHALAAIPWVALCVALGLLAVESELEDQALLDLPSWQVAAFVSLRRAAPALGIAAVGVLLTAAAEMTVTDLFRVRTIAEELYTAQALGDDGGLRGATFASLFCTAWLVGMALVLGDRLAPAVRSTQPRVARKFELGAGRWFGTSFVAIVLLFAFGVPLACLIYKAGLQVEMRDAERVRHWSLASTFEVTWRSLLQFREEIGWSTAAAATTALLATAIAAPIAWFARGGGWRGWLAAAASVAMLATPGPLLALVLLQALSRPDPAPLSFFSPLVGLTVEDGLLVWFRDQPISCLVIVQLWRALPWAIGILWFALRTVPRAQLDAAALDGLGAWARFWHIGVAQHRRALFAAALVAFVFAFGELPASVLVAPPGVVTLPIQVFNRLHYGAEKEVAGVCLGTLAILAGIMTLGLSAFRARKKG